MPSRSGVTSPTRASAHVAGDASPRRRLRSTIAHRHPVGLAELAVDAARLAVQRGAQVAVARRRPCATSAAICSSVDAAPPVSALSPAAARSRRGAAISPLVGSSRSTPRISSCPSRLRRSRSRLGRAAAIARPCAAKSAPRSPTGNTPSRTRRPVDGEPAVAAADGAGAGLGTRRRSCSRSLSVWKPIRSAASRSRTSAAASGSGGQHVGRGKRDVQEEADRVASRRARAAAPASGIR